MQFTLATLALVGAAVAAPTSDLRLPGYGRPAAAPLAGPPVLVAGPPGAPGPSAVAGVANGFGQIANGFGQVFASVLQAPINLISPIVTPIVQVIPIPKLQFSSYRNGHLQPYSLAAPGPIPAGAPIAAYPVMAAPPRAPRKPFFKKRPAPGAAPVLPQ